MVKDLEEYISTSQAAARYSFSVEHVRLLCRTERVQATQIGPMWVVNEASLLAYLAIKQARGWPRGRPRKIEPPGA